MYFKYAGYKTAKLSRSKVPAETKPHTTNVQFIASPPATLKHYNCPIRHCHLPTHYTHIRAQIHRPHTYTHTTCTVYRTTTKLISRLTLLWPLVACSSRIPCSFSRAPVDGSTFHNSNSCSRPRKGFHVRLMAGKKAGVKKWGKLENS